jgi:hypothetical protein
VERPRSLGKTGREGRREGRREGGRKRKDGREILLYMHNIP